MINGQPIILKVSQLFHQVKYEIPIYQRNYAWGEKQIEQLLEDIGMSKGNYFLGTLIVNQKDVDTFEVIDGQQRLTTLFLVQTYLRMNISPDALHFEAREKSNRTLKALNQSFAEELLSEEIIEGYKLIKGYFENNEDLVKLFIARLHDVQIIRIQVPTKIDLNHYFEIMNTRGEQLQLHEIAKAKLLSQLSTTEDKKAGAKIWDMCAQMDTYVQMNFDSKNRRELFSGNWSNLATNITHFDDLKNKIIEEDKENARSKTLFEYIQDKRILDIKHSNESEENERFESIISFPNFILQVNEALGRINEHESLLDDRNFLENIAHHWENEDSCKYFLFNLLKCRVLFDQYVIKREFAKNYKENGKWSLQRLESYKDGKSNTLKPKYVGTFEATKNNKLRTLQACLRITYTSPKTMHWISLVLHNLLHNKNVNLINLLENYCREKVKQSNFLESKGFGFERIVFTYLDYMLFCDGYKYEQLNIITPFQEDWSFQFRNSIEHFYPQNPSSSEPISNWSPTQLDSFGNLALITVSGNSKFSNLPPAGKISSYPSIIEQSLKLKIMVSMMSLNNNQWDEKIARIHQLEMFKLLENDISLKELLN